MQVKVLPHERPMWSSLVIFAASPGHRRFRQVDDDVHLDVPLTLREALLGAEAESHAV